MNLLGTCWIDPVRQSPRTLMFGSFTQGTVPPQRSYSLVSCFIQRSSSARLPRRFLAADCSVTRVSSRFRYYSAVRRLTQHCLAISLALIGWLTLAAGQRLRQSLLRSHVVLPYRAVRNHLGAVGE